MDKIRIDFVDFWKGFDKNDNFFISLLRQMYGSDRIEISNEPDYLFYSCFGNKNLRYTECVKICYVAENIVPDFNLCDYAIGVHDITFSDRYLWFPLYLQKEYRDSYELAVKRGPGSKDRKFCCFVISNALGSPMRDKLINEIEGYKKPDSGGRYKNNVGGPVKDKIDFLRGYKFNLCIENSSAPGYTTEKLIEGFAGGGIPIYWGDPDIGKKFNTKAFLNCMEYDDTVKVIQRIKELDQNDALYEEMLSQPIFAPGADRGEKELNERLLEDFLRNIFDQDRALAKRVNSIYVGRRYTMKMKKLAPALDIYRFLERCSGYLYNKRKQHNG
ncbi:MAG: hypothetical protein K6G22_13735 [Lachnospiraceae bacterium]|nr:hypothetical protein [Lachnospiraceae bacterium]